MKRTLLARAVVVALVLLALPAAADAPIDQYARFDGDARIIEDNFTGLDWDRAEVFARMTFDQVDVACQFIPSLESVGRLPTVKELLTLLDEEPHDEYEFSKLVPKLIDQNAFDGTHTPVDLPYWTSTPAPGVDMFWTLNFSTGLMVPLVRTAQANARCVR